VEPGKKEGRAQTGLSNFPHVGFFKFAFKCCGRFRVGEWAGGEEGKMHLKEETWRGGKKNGRNACAIAETPEEMYNHSEAARGFRVEQREGCYVSKGGKEFAAQEGQKTRSGEISPLRNGRIKAGAKDAQAKRQLAKMKEQEGK